MKINWIVNCPNCPESINLFDDEYFGDDLLDTSDFTYLKCKNCGQTLKIETIATYKFEVEKDEE